MPVNFGNYTYRPSTPLAFGGMGEGLDAIIQGNRERARLKQQESQYARTRDDTQNTNAATYARDTSKGAYDVQKGRYDKQRSAIEAARAASQSGHYDVADALIPTIRELGGQAQQNPDGTYRFQEGDAPALGAPDVGGARRQIYQGAPPGTGANQPFQVPGFGAGGQRNPFEPPAVSGASAAALPPPPVPAQSMNQGPPPAGALPSQSPPVAGPPPQPDAAGPLPGAAPDTGQGPSPNSMASSSAMSLSSAPAAVPSPQAQQSSSPQPTGPNPFQPPGLDPYTIDPTKVRERNDKSLQPFLGGLADAAGSRFKGRIEAINKHVSELNLPPAEAIKVTEKLYGEVFAQMRSGVTAEGQSGRLAQMGEHQQSIRDDKSRSFAVGRINKIIDNDSLKATKLKLTAAREAERLIPDAHRNGSSANALIESIYRMKNTGVMTDKDFERSSAGVQSLWGMIQKGVLNKLLHGGGGFDPTTVGDLKELVDTAMRSHAETMGIAANSLISAYRTAPNQIEKAEYNRAITSFLPEEYLPEEFVEPWMERARKQGATGQVIDIDAEDEQAAMQQMAADEGGVIDVTDNVPAGRHPTTPMVRSPRVPPKPPRKPPTANKDPKKMTDAELKAEMDRLVEEANAP